MRPASIQPRRAIPFAIISLLLSGAAALADHGPGTSGGGTATQSGETLKPGRFAVELRSEWTEFDDLSDTEIGTGAQASGHHFDALDRSFLTTVSVSYGIVDNFQAGFSIGWYDAVNARQGEFEEGEGGGETHIHQFDPDGLTDLWLSAKWRFYRGRLGQLALLGGVKLPVGEDDVKNDADEAVEPSSTAGSGAFDGMFGMAYSTWLTSHASLDASAQYILRGEHDDFQLGNRLDAGVAVNYRLTEDIQHFPQFSLFAEGNVRHLEASEHGGSHEENTGGTALFLSPGARVGFCKEAAFSIAPQFPVWQDLRGEQQETEFKVVATLAVSF